MKTFTLLAVFVMAAVAQADEAKDKAIEAYKKETAVTKEAAVKEAKTAIASAEAGLKATRRAVVNPNAMGTTTVIDVQGGSPPRTIYKTKEDKQKAIEDTMASIAKMKKNLADLQSDAVAPQPKDRTLPARLKLHSIGTLSNGSEVVVKQVVDASNAIVEVIGFEQGLTGVSGNVPIVGTQNVRTVVWIETNTEGMTDGTVFRIKGNHVWFVKGTKQYETAVGGTKTVFVLEKAF